MRPTWPGTELLTNRTVFASAFVWAALVVLVVHFVDFPGSVPNFRDVSRGGILLDAIPAFTSDGVYERLSAYGDAGRQNYSFRNVTVDILLPLSAFPFLFLLAFRAARESSARPLLPRLLLALPVLYVLFDFVENAIVLALLSRYPDRLEILASALPYSTVTKRVTSLSAVAIPLVLIASRFLRGKLRPKTVGV